jgi:hypothetical protein
MAAHRHARHELQGVINEAWIGVGIFRLLSLAGA